MVLSFFLFLPFPWLETKMFTCQFKVQIEKSTLINLSTTGNAKSGGQKTHVRSFFLSWTASFPSVDSKEYWSNQSEMDIKGVIPALKRYIITSTNDRRGFQQEGITKKASKKVITKNKVHKNDG